jgi:hypothetical protein
LKVNIQSICDKIIRYQSEGGDTMAKQNLDRLKSIDDKIAQLKAQKTELRAREKKKERAERTRRLIQNGALAEQYLNAHELSPIEFEGFLKALIVLVPDFNDLTVQVRQKAGLPLEQIPSDNSVAVAD